MIRTGLQTLVATAGIYHAGRDGRCSSTEQAGRCAKRILLMGVGASVHYLMDSQLDSKITRWVPLAYTSVDLIMSFLQVPNPGRDFSSLLVPLTGKESLLRRGLFGAVVAAAASAFLQKKSLPAKVFSLISLMTITHQNFFNYAPESVRPNARQHVKRLKILEVAVTGALFIGLVYSLRKLEEALKNLEQTLEPFSK